RFTYAGDFLVEDLSENYRVFELFGLQAAVSSVGFFPGKDETPNPNAFLIRGRQSTTYVVENSVADDFGAALLANSTEISDELYEVLRIESGTPKYGVDMDETTIVPELDLEEMISYTKGCYIGQEIIARIHFRGHVAKQLTGLILSSPPYEGGVAEGRGGSL